ncbi:MAG: hypothetical protein NC100_04685 [Clostridium sp.]|nr:hypothetical protein [Clostridium sp.]
MIETKNEVSKNLEKVLQELQRAKQHVANEKKKQNEKKRKAENHYKYIMGGIIVKYFPDCYSFDEGELNRSQENLKGTLVLGCGIVASYAPLRTDWSELVARRDPRSGRMPYDLRAHQRTSR